jgi:hypothetical protein
MGQMSTGGGRISLRLAVGVDRGHPQAVGSGSQPPPMAGSIYLFFFFWFGSPERQIWLLRMVGSLPLAVGVDRGHPQWPDLSSSSFFVTENVTGGRRWVAALFAGGGRWVIHLVA